MSASTTSEKEQKTVNQNQEKTVNRNQEKTLKHLAINALCASFKKSFARKALGGRKNCADELFFVTLWWISEEVHR